jgi:K(+)-stimulated pyrophosphate-energized sodium pump
MFSIFIQGSAIISALIALVYSFFTAKNILSLPDGNNAMRAIARAIQEGASAYLSRQYRSIFIVGCIVTLILWWSFDNFYVTTGFILGAFLSGISGYIGMNISVRANVRTTEAAKSGVAKALSVAFRSGAVVGFMITGLGLLGVAVYYAYLVYMGVSIRHLMEALVALGFGASLISIFARLGGGIFTKGADVGADLVGKVESGIPEDDPRNPAVIADNVGDNVGDCAGMGADLFETYVVTLVAAIQMAFLVMPQYNIKGVIESCDRFSLALYPFFISAVCLCASLAGIFFVKFTKSIMGALYKGLTAAIGFSVGGLFLFTLCLPDDAFSGRIFFSKWSLLTSAYIGIMTTALLVRVTEYYTSDKYGPVKSIAQASMTGVGTNLIQGLAISMQSCFVPALVVGFSIIAAYKSAGMFGIAIAALSMLALMGMVIAIDAYGPVTDNAGGIAEMAGLPESVRQVTDQLDAVGNTTKAITKGYAIGSAALASLVLFSAYIYEAGHHLKNATELLFDLKNPNVMVGLLIGGAIPYLFAAMSMKAVGRAGAVVVTEVRRQFKEIKGIMQYSIANDTEEGRPDYGKTVDLLTKMSIRAMIIPSLLPVLLPIGLYGVARVCLKSKQEAIIMVGGALLGLILTGFFIAVSMTSGGGAWDNAKKYIEAGNCGGKGSPAYVAAVIGDTVGDPYKDTAGSAINPLIKIANLAAILMLALL